MAQHVPSAPDALSLSGVRVWDGERDRGVVSLSWRGDEITEVASSTNAASDYSVIPGLIDTHVHLDTNASTHKADRAWAIITPPEERSLHIVSHSMAAMRGGVTTMRDLASEPAHFAVGRAFDSGIIAGPRLLGGGPVGMTAGHGDLFTPPHYPHRPPVADSPDECRKLVREWARAGSYSIKIYTSGGVLSMGDKVGWRNHTDAEIAATVDEAHALGMLVAAHSHTSNGIDIALRHGVDSIEHATGLSRENIPLLASMGIPVTPTILIHDRLHANDSGVDEETLSKSHTVTGTRDARLLEAARGGIRFVLGTDANGVWTLFGDQMAEVREMRRLFDWTPERALRSATSDAADAIGLGDRIGRIRPGAGADFVVMRGTPWNNIDELDTDRIVAVVSRGRVLSGALPE
jgi:imidazolonepropionase-like amidohydrolase